jgi:hypothetical protein
MFFSRMRTTRFINALVCSWPKLGGLFRGIGQFSMGGDDPTVLDQYEQIRG